MEPSANKREIFIRLQNIKEVVENLEEIKKLQKETQVLFKHYEAISSKENKLFENWNNYLEDIALKLEHITN